MDLTSKRVIKGLLKKYQIRPSKRLGQNFLIDKKAVKKVVRASDLQLKDIILEIGPGMGALTQELAQKVYSVKSRKAGISPETKLFNRAGKVIAVEKDKKMIEILKKTLREYKNVKIIQGDILKIFNFQFSIFNYKIIANLPFYITAPVIRKFLEAEHPPKEMILMVQKEVAQRICAKPPKANLLAVSVQFYARSKIISYISKKSFWPIPKVDSAIIKIIPRSSAYGSASFREQFFRIVKAGFSQPRKQLANNLAKGLALSTPNGLALSSPNGLKLNKPSQILKSKTWAGKEQVNNWLLKNNIQPSQRAGTLTIKDWINLTKSIKIK